MNRVINSLSCGLAAAFLFHALPLSAQQGGPQNPKGIANERQFDACRHALARACFKPAACARPNQTGPCMVSICKTVAVPVGNETLYAGAFGLGMVITARTYRDFRELKYSEAVAYPDVTACGNYWDAFALVKTYGNARERAAFDGSGPALGPVASAPVPGPAPQAAPVPPPATSSSVRPKTPAEIRTDACDRAMESVRKAIMGRPQSESEKVKALGATQKSIFSGGCKDHPKASQFIAQADRMIATGRMPSATPRPERDTKVDRPIQGGHKPGDGPPSEGLIKVCEGNYQGMLRQVNGLQIAEREKDRIRAQQTLAVYKGGCSRVPGAQARMVAAERVLARLGIGGGGNVAGGGEPKGIAKKGGSGGGSCDTLLRTLRKQILSGRDEAAMARALGSWQKKFYTDNCKTDSNSAQLVAEAEQMMRTGRLPAYLKSGNWDGGPNFAGGESKPASTELINVCEGDYQAMRSQALKFQLPMAEINRIIAQQTIAIFKGRCSTVPGARERIAQAEKMLGGSSGGAGGSNVAGGSGGGPSGGSSARGSKRRHVPEAVASQCLSLNPGGGFKNSCPYAIEYSYCVFRPKKDSWSESFDCDKNKIGSWHMGPYGSSIGHAAGQKVHWIACKYGAAIGDGQPDGISPADVKWDSRQGRLTFRCAEWGAG